MKQIIMIFLFIIIIGCQPNQPPDQQQETDGMQEVTGKYALELEKTACSSAEDAGTCNTKLASLGFITKEECCEKFKKCC